MAAKNINLEELESVAEDLAKDRQHYSNTKLKRRERKKLAKEIKAKRKRIEKEKQQLKQRQAKIIRDNLKARESSLEKPVRRARKKRLKASDVNDFIGYNMLLKNGVCEVDEGLYSETIEFSDVSYQSAREDSQKILFSQMCSLYDTFSSDTAIQMTIQNRVLAEEELEQKKLIEMNQPTEELQKYANIYEDVLKAKQKEGLSNIERRRFITYMVGANSIDDASKQLAKTRNDVSSCLQSVKAMTHKLDGVERLKLLNSFLKPNVPLDFDYDRDIRRCYGSCTKDYVAPMAIDFNPFNFEDCFEANGVYGQVLLMNTFGSELTDRVIADIVDLDIPLSVTCHVRATDKAESITLAQQKQTWVDADIAKREEKATKEGYVLSSLPAKLKHSKESVDAIVNLLQNENQRLYWFTGLIYTYATSIEELKSQVNEIMKRARKNSVYLTPLELRQKEALNSVLPLGMCHVKEKRSFLTCQQGIFIPFATTEINDEGGCYVGQNKESCNLVINNRKLLTNPMGIVCGMTGWGKSFFVKNEFLQTVLNNPKDQILLIDPSGEYKRVIESIGGRVIELSIKSNAKLNPFDIGSSSEISFDEQLSSKIEAMIAGASAGTSFTKEGLDDTQMSFISTAVTNVFHKANINNETPLLRDFVNELANLDVDDEYFNRKAKELSIKFHRYVSEPYDFFNGESNVDFSNRITAITIKDLPKSMLPFALVNVFEAIKKIIYKNHDEGRYTWLYVDEIQSMMEYPAVLNYLSRFVREDRKFSLIFTGITQRASSLLASEEAKDIVLQANYLVLLKQDADSVEKWTDTLKLSDIERSYIEDIYKSGEGLLISGGRHVPFYGDFPEDNDAYKIFSTKPEDN